MNPARSLDNAAGNTIGKGEKRDGNRRVEDQIARKRRRQSRNYE